MTAPRLTDVVPVLPSKDVSAAIDYYVNRLGFVRSFVDNEAEPHYAGIRRNNVMIHLQWHDPAEWSAVERPMLRFFVESVAELFAEYGEKDVFHQRTALRKTDWGTEEFAFYDIDGNGLTFARNLDESE